MRRTSDPKTVHGKKPPSRREGGLLCAGLFSLSVFGTHGLDFGDCSRVARPGIGCPLWNGKLHAEDPRTAHDNQKNEENQNDSGRRERTAAVSCHC